MDDRVTEEVAMTIESAPAGSVVEVDTHSGSAIRPWTRVVVGILALVLGGVVGWVLRGESDSTAVPAEISELIDDWQDALERGDGSVVGLYTPTGYHLYGDTRYSGDEIAAHLQGGDPEDHEWVTEPVLIVDAGDGRYVVTGGMSNNVGGVWYTSAITYEVVTTPDGLRLAQTAWSKVS